ncbi:hypothetical protein PFLUV_G00075000 [Perca fluviatilis]|uniref:Uncharacterized protein n=1 Tax=Perca fluviatilis TaxID=8168 RepID=A0A6A5FD61_PERFL|nr:hypothetical protein PFLUV_G00075000 [Perca fluviatilis]
MGDMEDQDIGEEEEEEDDEEEVVEERDTEDEVEDQEKEEEEERDTEEGGADECPDNEPKMTRPSCPIRKRPSRSEAEQKRDSSKPPLPKRPKRDGKCLFKTNREVSSEAEEEGLLQMKRERDESMLGSIERTNEVHS